MNEKTQRTPGPWFECEVRGASDKENIYIADGEDDYKSDLVASVFAYGSRRPIGQANARLIAAAPELLAALEAIHEAGRTSDQSRAIWCAEIARAAIAKAKEAQS